MTADRVMVDRMFEDTVGGKRVWRRVRYMVSGENLRDRLPDKSTREIAMEKTAAMLTKRTPA